MEYQTNAGARTLAESLQYAHKLADMIEQGLLAADAVLSGCGQAGNAAGSLPPSVGILGDASSLASRMERILSAVNALNGAMSSPPNVVDYSDARAQAGAAYGVTSGNAASQLYRG